jgi:hypothetical protein
MLVLFPSPEIKPKSFNTYVQKIIRALFGFRGPYTYGCILSANHPLSVLWDMYTCAMLLLTT